MEANVCEEYLGVPKLARLVERSGDDLVAPGIVERNRVNDVAVPVESQQLVPRGGFPNLFQMIEGWRDQAIVP